MAAGEDSGENFATGGVPWQSNRVSMIDSDGYISNQKLKFWLTGGDGLLWRWLALCVVDGAGKAAMHCLRPRCHMSRR